MGNTGEAERNVFDVYKSFLILNMVYELKLGLLGTRPSNITIINCSVTSAWLLPQY